MQTINKPGQRPWWMVAIHLSGNMMDHYDSALWGFMVPVVAPLFFPHHDPVASWIAGYGVMIAGWIMRPLGGFFWGRKADGIPPLLALAFVFSGMALCTLGTGLLPVFSDAGIVAPLLLFTLKGLQSFFGAGETTLAPLTLLEGTSRKPVASGWFHSSTVLGCMMASGVSWWVMQHPHPEHAWRWPFQAGGLLALAGMLLRFHVSRTGEKPTPVTEAGKGWAFVPNNVRILAAISAVSVAGWVTYSVPFLLLNTLFPLVNPSVTVKEMMAWNTGLLALDGFLLPLVGRVLEPVLKKYTPETLMRGCLLQVAAALGLGFPLLPHMSLNAVLGLRLAVILPGLVWTVLLSLRMAAVRNRYGYAVIGLGSNLGTELLGRSIPWMGLALFKAAQSPVAPALWLLALCALAFHGLNRLPGRTP